MQLLKVAVIAFVATALLAGCGNGASSQNSVIESLADDYSSQSIAEVSDLSDEENLLAESDDTLYEEESAQEETSSGGDISNSTIEIDDSKAPVPQAGTPDVAKNINPSSKVEEKSAIDENLNVEEAPKLDEKATVDPREIETELFRLINNERVAVGENVLESEENALWAAQIRAPEVIVSLSHTRPDGTPYYTAFDEAEYLYAGKWHGENVSYMAFTKGLYNSKTAAKKMFDSLKASPGHYKNMINSNFAIMGVGASVSTEGDIIKIGSSQLFSGR